MNQFAQCLLAFAACASWSFTMNRHRRDAGADGLSESGRWVLRMIGTVLSCAAFGLALLSRSLGVAIVEFVSLFGLSALCLVLVLNYAPRAVVAIATTACVVSSLLVIGARS